MRKLLFFSPIACLALLCHAQPGKTDMAVIEKIKAEEKNHSQIASIAHNLTDVCGPRLTNSPGYQQAIDWVTKTFKEWGLQNAGPEAWGEFGKGWTNDQSTIAMRKPYYQPIIGYPEAWGKSTAGKINAPLLLLTKFDSATIDKLGDSIKGRILIRKSRSGELQAPAEPAIERHTDSSLRSLPDMYMLTRGFLDTLLPFIKSNYYTTLYAEKKGALAMINTSQMRDGTVVSQGGPGYKTGYEALFPEVNIPREDYLRLVRLLEDKIPVTMDLDIKNTFYDKDLNGYNVVGEIAGTDPALKNQVVMLGGHLDSWGSGTGATDNGAGCIVMMEAIRILKTLGVQPRRTIRIALWGGEEQGLYGSFGYVKKHYGDPADMKLKPEQKNISAYFNLDNGSGKIRGIYLQNNEAVRDIFKAWLEPFADMGATAVTSSNTGSTDHLSFDAVGIPGFQFVQDPLEYETRTHHSNMDVYDHLYLEDLKQAATVVAAFVYQTAMRDEMLPRKPLPKPQRFVFDFDFPF